MKLKSSICSLTIYRFYTCTAIRALSTLYTNLFAVLVAVCICVCVCVCVCVYIYIYIYIHTDIYIYERKREREKCTNFNKFFLKLVECSNTDQQSRIKPKRNVSSPPYIHVRTISFIYLQKQKTKNKTKKNKFRWNMLVESVKQKHPVFSNCVSHYHKYCKTRLPLVVIYVTQHLASSFFKKTLMHLTSFLNLLY